MNPKLRQWIAAPSQRDATGIRTAARRAALAALDRGADPEEVLDALTLPRALSVPLAKSVRLTAFGDLTKGNANSGNWGHEGRPGQVGGSLPKGGGGGAAVPGHRSAQTGRRYPEGVIPPPAKPKIVEPHLGVLPPRDFTSLEKPLPITGDSSDLGKGVNSAEMITDATGHTFVFKSVENERFHMRDDIRNEEATLAEREVLAARVDKELGLGIVPRTVLAENEGRLGMAQDFIEGGHEIYHVEKPSAREDLAKMAAFDAVIGNQDRHGGNWLAVERNQHLVAIDHGYAFGVTGPGGYIRSIALTKVKNGDLSPAAQRELAASIKTANWDAVFQGAHLDSRERAALKDRARIVISRLENADIAGLRDDFDVSD